MLIMKPCSTRALLLSRNILGRNRIFYTLLLDIRQVVTVIPLAEVTTPKPLGTVATALLRSTYIRAPPSIFPKRIPLELKELRRVCLHLWAFVGLICLLPSQETNRVLQ